MNKDSFSYKAAFVYFCLGVDTSARKAKRVLTGEVDGKLCIAEPVTHFLFLPNVLNLESTLNILRTQLESK